MNLIYKVDDKPKFGQLIIFALQQLFAIMTATLVVPVIVSGTYGFGNVTLSPAAALFGAGVGTLIYVLFTKRKSPVFLGSSFAFIGSMTAAFAGAVSMALGVLGLILGAIFAGLVYVILALITKKAGVKWIDKIMPLAVIGPVVALIGLNLAPNAVGDLQNCAGIGALEKGNVYLCILCGLVTLFVTIICSTFGKKMVKLIPFIIGILAGYALALILTIIGHIADVNVLKIISFEPFKNLLVDGHVAVKTFVDLPKFTFIEAFKGFKDLNFSYVLTIFVAYTPVALVCFAEHLADHKNLSSIIDQDLLAEPGLHRTLLGDGIGSIGGAFFGGCPNTTYGESIGCVAITKNASVLTIITAAVMAIIVSFLSPFVAFVNSIPSCVMGGVCIALYGFIAVSGLKMIQKVDLSLNKNLFVVSTILITGIGGLILTFGKITITNIAVAMILGIILNQILKHSKEDEAAPSEEKQEQQQEIKEE